MREELSKEEFEKRRRAERYQRNKKERIEKQLERYYRNKKEDEELIEEIYKDVYSQLPEPVDLDKYYTEKFKKDDTVS